LRNIKVGPVVDNHQLTSDQMIKKMVRKSGCGAESYQGLIESLQSLAEIKSDKTPTESYKAIFGETLDGALLISWIFNRVKKIQCGWLTNAPNGGLTLKGFRKGKITFPRKYKGTVGEVSLKDSIVLQGILIHEAKHAEGLRTLHINMDIPDIFDGYPILSSCSSMMVTVCDDSFSDPYGVQAIFHGNMALNCDDCSKEEKKLHTMLSLSFFERLVNPTDRLKLVSDLKYDELVKKYNIDLKNFRRLF